jgi:hypothetical protein
MGLFQTVHDKEQQNEVEFAGDCDSGARPSQPQKVWKRLSIKRWILSLFGAVTRSKQKECQFLVPFVFRKCSPLPPMKVWYWKVSAVLRKADKIQTAV